MHRQLLFSFAAALSLAGCAPSSAHIPAVRDFDSAQYLGKWHEIARLPHRFERGLDRVTAEYSAAPDGSIAVINRGMRGDEPRSIRGKAKLKHPKQRPPTGELRVSFFGPFCSDYRIIELPPDYRYAVVTGGTMDYLWILARSPRLEAEELRGILHRLAALGFAVDKLEYPEPAAADGRE